VPSQPTQPPVTTTKPPTTRSPTTAEAVATALSYARRELGIRAPAAGPFGWTGVRTGQVAVHPSRDPNGRPFTNPPLTVLTLQRLTKVWWVTGAQTRTIQITEPDPFDRVASPVLVTGRAIAFEGHVPVRITEDRYGPDRLLGSGYVLGRGDGVLGPFSKRIAFKAPTGTTGSLIFSDVSAANGDVMAATVVRVRFTRAPAAPRILGVSTVPTLRDDGGWWLLPDAAGTVTFVVRATGAIRVTLSIVPTGTGMLPPYQEIGRDTTPGDGFRIAWRYTDEPLIAHLIFDAYGPGGHTSLTHNVQHQE
jgi:hypothetical protein